MKHKTKKQKFKGLSVKWKIFIYFSVFTLIMLILLWLFQIVFLNSFYRLIKTNEIKECAEEIIDNIESENIDEIIEKICTDNYICVRVINTTFQDPFLFNDIYSVGTTKSGRILYMSYMDLYRCYIDAKEKNNGVSMFFFQEDNENYTFPNKNNSNTPYTPYTLYPYTIIPDNYRSHSNSSNIFIFNIEGLPNNDSEIYHFKNNYFSDRISIDDRNNAENLIYVAVITDSKNRELMILLDSYITPVTSTVQTLTIQLIIITVILIFLGMIMSFIISRKISKPIITINKSAKVLAQGDYNVKFEGEGYSEISELTNTLNYAAQELSQVENLRHELIANISHDLRTPLTMITGYAEIMRDLPGENTPENVQMIIDEANRLNTLVTALLDLSKLQAGVQKPELNTYNLTQSIRDIFKRYSKLREQDGYIIEFYANEEVFVNADEIKMNQVIYNLINNAINYVGDDKTVIVKQIVKPENDCVKIEITDHGEGISEDKLKYIWDRYYKADKSHRRAVIGTGLGLSIVKSILEMHNFSYGVISKEGEGSTFWFELRKEKIQKIKVTD